MTGLHLKYVESGGCPILMKGVRRAPELDELPQVSQEGYRGDHLRCSKASKTTTTYHSVSPFKEPEGNQCACKR